jgi:TRAP-type C4-dicarboxylate transport system permease small subunit
MQLVGPPVLNYSFAGRRRRNDADHNHKAHRKGGHGRMSEVPNAQSAEPAEPAVAEQMSIAKFILVRIPHYVCGVLLLAAIAINVANVVGRYVFSRPVDWAEEVLIYMIVWGVFISLGSITYQGLHLRMDLLVLSVKGWFRTFLGGLTAVLMLACAIFMMFQTWTILQLYYASGETSMGAKIPLLYPHTALLVGFAGLAVAVVIRFRCYLTGKFD